ncbi:MAG: hypothetical protein IT210_21890 [Armatimonadetes bacterium]|nr:hypothetical protein [Armatimonadota bacterium]
MVDREQTCRRVERLQKAFGDILPVALVGTQRLHGGLTGDLFRLIGNDSLLVWIYDEPEAIHRLMAYLRDDRMAYFRFLEEEGLLGSSNNWTFVGSGSPGYTTCLPQPGDCAIPRLKDLWLGMESQETTCISPAMFEAFFLPYMADLCEKFGLVYYGCCEPAHDRWERIVKAIPNVRAVSISPWNDLRLIAEKLGQNHVCSRKPRPGPISGSNPGWDSLARDLDETLAAARNCNLEIIFRDIYRIGGERHRLKKWVDMVRSRIGGE